ncbi:MAG TPA: response regulator [Candidatus Binatia bacterium]|nr:response regulator [Candidatus Binatia bacterium]
MTDSELSDVLLIEDTLSMARVYLEYLKRGPFRARHCMTGQEALADITQRRTDAVLLDLRLPDMDGLDVLKHIRSREIHAAVVVITADGSLNRAVEAMREGALDFLVKPFNADRLLITLGNVLERRRLNSMVESLSGHNGNGGSGQGIQPLRITERNAIEQAIRASDGNIVKAAALLEISASTIYRKLAHWHESPDGGEEPAMSELHA